MTDTALGIPFIKSEVIAGFNFELLPRRGTHKDTDVAAAMTYIRDNYNKVAEINAIWLPRLPGPPVNYNNDPHLMFRTQLITGLLSPAKRAVWCSMDFEDYSISVGLYDGAPESTNLLPQACITFSDGKHRYTITGEELAFILESDKTIVKKKLK